MNFKESKNVFFAKGAIQAVETKADGTLTIKGLASTPDLDRYSDKVKPEAFASSLAQYMKLGTLLVGHDTDKPCGRVTDANISTAGLNVTGSVTIDVDGTLFQALQSGALGAFSIGFICKSYENQNLDGTPWTGDPWDAPCRVITDLDLVEISIVSTPANPNALFSLQKSAAEFLKKARDMEREEAAKERKEAPADAAASPEPKDETKTQDEAGNAGENPAAAKADAETADKADGVEAPASGAPAATETKPEGAENAPTATPDDAQALKDALAQVERLTAELAAAKVAVSEKAAAVDALEIRAARLESELTKGADTAKEVKTAPKDGAPILLSDILYA